MRLGSSGTITFKPYQPGQATFLPPSLDELIAPEHLVRVVSQAIDRMDIEPLLAAYPGGGTSAYHPKMLLKVIVYGYVEGVYGSRRIAKALRENVAFMWLAAGNRPDFRTIARFRSSRLKASVDEVFASLMELLIEADLVRLETGFVDGTKLEAQANRYSYIWAKTTDRHQQALRQKIARILAEIDEEVDREDDDYGDRDLEELEAGERITPERLAAKVAALNERLKAAPEDKPLKKALKTLEGDALPRLTKYEAQERMLAGRRSCSKTDPEATFMRLKEDHLQNGQLRAAYNVQLTTENQFILAWSVHQSAGDPALLVPHLQKLARLYGRLPRAVVADAAYGSEENYAWTAAAGVAGYMNYPGLGTKRRKKVSAFASGTWPYDEATDTITCPAGERLVYTETVPSTTTTGYRSQRRVYRARACGACAVRDSCLSGSGNRSVRRGVALEAYRAAARERLLSDEGVRLRKRRGVEVEGAFAQIKQNMQFRRFLLRGLAKTNVECGLLAMAHNLKKWWRQAQAAAPEPSTQPVLG